MKNELYDSILNMNINSETVTGVFADDDHDTFLVVEKIVALANEEHRANCKTDKNCQGVLPYFLKHLKIMLTSHEEYTPDFVLAIVAGVFSAMGKEMEKVHSTMESIDKPDKLGKLLKKIFGEENVKIHKVDLTDKEDD